MAFDIEEEEEEENSDEYLRPRLRMTGRKESDKKVKRRRREEPKFVWNEEPVIPSSFLLVTRTRCSFVPITSVKIVCLFSLLPGAIE